MEHAGGVPLSRVSELIEGFRQRLESVGIVCAESGELCWPGGRLSIHTDFGPADQDKDTNQDFVVAWVAKNESSAIEWAIAVADGVSSSFQAEVGARIACWAGLSQLVVGEDDFDGICRRSMDAAGDAVGLLADELTGDAERFCPPWEFASTWKFTLREGLLLQTTLTLAWVENKYLNVAIVGDGGVGLFGFTGDAVADNGVARVLGGADPETNRVHALGPVNRHVSAFDFCDRVELNGPGVIAVFTDGVGRGVAGEEGELLAGGSKRAAGEAISAQGVIEKLVEDRPAEFEDNLTLALIARD